METIIRNIVANHIGIQEKMLKADSLLVEDYGLDEIDFEEIRFNIKQFFKHDVSVDDLKKCSTTESLITFIKTKMRLA